jgi:hypothetical protein
MKIIGEGSIRTYEPRDECPHAPGEGNFWSESFAIMLWDTTQNVHVFLHLTQEPNRDGKGFTTVWLNAWTPEHLYHHTDDSVPLKPGDITRNAITAGESLCRYEYDSQHRWSVRDVDVNIDMVMEDYHPGLGYYPAGSGSFKDSTQKEHFESSGWIKGTVSVKGSPTTCPERAGATIPGACATIRAFSRIAPITRCSAVNSISTASLSSAVTDR